MADRSDAVVIGSGDRPGKHHQSLFDIIATLEQYSLCEREGGHLPEEAVTRVVRWHFIEIGLKHGFITSLPLLITAPLGMAVLHRYLPVFGKAEVSLIDKIYALLLSSMPSLASIIFLSVMMSLLYHGNVTKKCLNSTVQGVLIGKILGHFLCFSVFHGLYFYILKSSKTYAFLYSLAYQYKVLSPKAAQNVVHFVYTLQEPVLNAAWYVVALLVMAILIFTWGYLYGALATRRYDQFVEKWQLR